MKQRMVIFLINGIGFAWIRIVCIIAHKKI